MTSRDKPLKRGSSTEGSDEPRENLEQSSTRERDRESHHQNGERYQQRNTRCPRE